MDVINKLRSTVSSVSNSLSTVLPGNPVTREYEVGKHLASAGPGMLWKVYAGVKKSTKEEAAIFVLQKSQLDRYSKRDKELLIDVLKKGVSQMTRLRHPSILTVQHPLEESRDSLAFATEPVFSSLANILGNHENMPSPLPTELKDYSLQDVEIKYGMLQLGEGLAFLHNDVKMLHRNVCPESILVNSVGAWKLAGFEFSIANSARPDQSVMFDYIEWDQELPPATQPNLNYFAPEYGLTMLCGPASDMYSLGAIIYAIYNDGSPLHSNCNTWNVYKENANSLTKMTASKLVVLPQGLQEHGKMLLSATPELRPDALQFTKLPFFEDVGVKTLQYLDSLFQWDNLQKSQFYKGLPQVLETLPKRVCLFRILPCLVKEYVNPEMVPFVLPNILFIAQLISKDQFLKHVLPHLIPIFRLQEPVQVLLIFLQKMELLLTKCMPEDVRNHILPMIHRSLESDAQQIQELSLQIIPNFAHLIDFPSIKNSLLPRIKKLCIATSYLSVRVNCLVCIGQLLEHLDKWIIMDDIFPALQEIPSKEPAVLMGIVGIYKMTLSHKKLGISKDVIASKIIPFLMPLTIESSLTLNQFNSLMGLIKDLVEHVETDQRAKLEQLNSIQQEQKHTLNMAQSPSKNDIFANLGSSSKLDITSKNHDGPGSVFKSLGLNNYLTQSHNTTSNTKADQNISSTSASKASLSMADKEKLVREQEQKRRLHSQQPLTAKPLSPTGSQQSTGMKPVKDLTSTLISSNLANMSMVLPPRATSPNYNMNTANFGNMPRMPPPQGMMMNSINQPLNNPFGAQQTRPMMNMSSLDNLVVTPGGRPKIPMGQMATSNANPWQQPNTARPQNFANFSVMQPTMSQIRPINNMAATNDSFPKHNSSSVSSNLDDLLS